jgi:uncharacterized protein (DUF952 family)
MSNIFHIVAAEDWAAAGDQSAYRHPSLESEGFIHLSSRDEVVATTGRYYADVTGLVLLEVDPSSLDDELKWEPAPTMIMYPHLYGPLPKTAVIAVHDWSPESQRAFDQEAN